MPGMRMSRKHSSGRSASACWTALSPSPHLATTRSSGHSRASSARRPGASSGSSSAISAVAVHRGECRVPGGSGQRDASRACRLRRRCAVASVSARARAVQRGEPLAHLLQAEARAVGWRRAPSTGRRRCRARCSTSALAVARGAATSIRPPSTCGSRPCLIAFSTSGCSSSGGTGSVAQFGGQLEARRRSRGAHAHLPSAPGSRRGARTRPPADAGRCATRRAWRAGTRSAGRASPARAAGRRRSARAGWPAC